MSTINERFVFILNEKYGGNVSEFARQSGIPQGTLNNIVGNRLSKPSFESISKLVSSDETIDARWILTGEGDMNRKVDILKIHTPPYLEHINEHEIVPLYDIEAAANLKMTMYKDKENVIGYLSIPDMPTVDGAVAVRGDSMYPIIKSGDIVVYKWISSPEYITYGEMYLVNYLWGDDRHVVVKYVKRSQKEGYVTLISYNSHHEPIDIPISCIQSIALVKVSIRYNTIS